MVVLYYDGWPLVIAGAAVLVAFVLARLSADTFLRAAIPSGVVALSLSPALLVNQHGFGVAPFWYAAHYYLVGFGRPEVLAFLGFACVPAIGVAALTYGAIWWVLVGRTAKERRNANEGPAT